MIGVPMKEIIWLPAGFEKSNMGTKINEYTGKNSGFTTKLPNISCFTVRTLFTMVLFQEFLVNLSSTPTFDHTSCV
jgi:hypothetical protein